MSLTAKRILVGALVLALVALLGSRALAEIYADALWFQHLGYGQVFRRIFWVRAALHTIFGLLAGAFCFANLTAPFRLSPTFKIRRRRYGNLEIAEAIPTRYWVAGAAVGSLLFGVWSGNYLARTRTFEILVWLHAVPWGARDPVFGRDLGFYVFDLPAYSALHTYTVLVLLGTAILTIVTHLLAGGIRIAGGRLHIQPEVRTHALFFAGCTYLVVAWGYWLGLYGLLNSGRSPTDALGYTDAIARIPGHRVLIVVNLLAALATFAAIRRRSRILVAGSAGLVLFALAFVDRAYPAALQKLRVDPNELALERPYIRMNMEFTRHAYGLDRVERAFFRYQPGARPDARRVEAALAGLPLWDAAALKAVYEQVQTAENYHTFPDVDFDRYGDPAAPELVAISAREVDTTRIAPEGRTWQNLHASTAYGRGVGVVVSAASRTGPAGETIDYLAGLPPVPAAEAPAGLSIEWPDIYFGERTGLFLLYRPVDGGAPQPRSVALGSWFRRLTMAWAFEDRNILLSHAARGGAHILYRREIGERLKRLMPLLVYEPLGSGTGVEAYPVLAGGRIHWIAEAYTATLRFPLAQRGPGGVRYLRNSVKATVDALSGSTRFYVVDPEDPIVRALDRVSPRALTPIDSMPPELRRHLRYSTNFLKVQSSMLLVYHVPGPDSLYHSVDIWDAPRELYPGEEESPVEPYPVLLPDPATGKPEFVTLHMFTPRARGNLRAFLTARASANPEAGLVLHHLPAEPIPGPRQVEALIAQDPFIAQELGLWAQRGATVTRGHLLVVPVDSAFVYVKPIYVSAPGGGPPRLRRIIVSDGARVGVGTDVPSALVALESGVRPAEISLPEEPVTTVGVPAGPGWIAADSLRALIERADSALRRGDLRTFSDLWDEIRRLGRRLGVEPARRP